MNETSDSVRPSAQPGRQVGAGASDEQRQGRIVVGVDGSASSTDALRLAARLANALGASVEAVTVWRIPAGFEVSLLTGWSPEQDARATLDAAAQAVFGAVPPVWFHSKTKHGSAARVLMDESAGAAMLVLGSRGRGGFKGLLLGSVSAVCAEHADCPVLVVHPSLVVHASDEG